MQVLALSLRGSDAEEKGFRARLTLGARGGLLLQRAEGRSVFVGHVPAACGSNWLSTVTKCQVTRSHSSLHQETFNVSGFIMRAK